MIEADAAVLRRDDPAHHPEVCGVGDDLDREALFADTVDNVRRDLALAETRAKSSRRAARRSSEGAVSAHLVSRQLVGVNIAAEARPFGKHKLAVHDLRRLSEQVVREAEEEHDLRRFVGGHPTARGEGSEGERADRRVALRANHHGQSEARRQLADPHGGDDAGTSELDADPRRAAGQQLGGGAGRVDGALVRGALPIGARCVRRRRGRIGRLLDLPQAAVARSLEEALGVRRRVLLVRIGIQLQIVAERLAQRPGDGDILREGRARP